MNKVVQEAIDIVRAIPGYRPNVVFDVGANVGQSCIRYAAVWPNARIHAFEPVPATFGRLAGAVAAHRSITAHNVALGRAPGSGWMAGGASTEAHLVREPGAEQEELVEVRIVEGHAVAAELGVAEISYLKIDTEGFDLDVLMGFAPMLDKVDFVQVEAGMNPYNTTHVPFRDLEDFLRAHGFLLFKFYEQQLEFKQGGRPVLRRTNPLFINARLADLRGIR